VSTLSKLTLTAAVKPRHIPDVQQRRNKLIHRIWEQTELARAQIEGRIFTTTRYRSVKDPQTGLRKQLEVPKRVRPWWFVAEDGTVCINIRYGTKPLEIVKGKTGIVVKSPDDVVRTLELIKQAVAAGELDDQMAAASGSLKSGFAR
jgi:hypothetical protein